MCTSTSCGVFSDFESARVVGDADWRVALYNRVCFEGKQRRRGLAGEWRLLVPRAAGAPPAASYQSSGFELFKLRAELVDDPSAAFAERCAGSAGGQAGACAGVAYLADLKHPGVGPPGLAHFCKRTLRLFGMQAQAARYGLPRVGTIVFPATQRFQLQRSDWLLNFLSLAAPGAEVVTADELAGRCFAHLAVSERESTYFVRPPDADALRSAAHARAANRPTPPYTRSGRRSRARGRRRAPWRASGAAPPAAEAAPTPAAQEERAARPPAPPSGR